MGNLSGHEVPMTKAYTLSRNTFPLPSPEVLRLAEAALQQVEDQIPERGIVEISPDGELICAKIKPPQSHVKRLQTPIRLGTIGCVVTLKITGERGERKLARYLSTPTEGDRMLREAWDTLQDDWVWAVDQRDPELKAEIKRQTRLIRETKSRNDERI